MLRLRIACIFFGAIIASPIPSQAQETGNSKPAPDPTAQTAPPSSAETSKAQELPAVQVVTTPNAKPVKPKKTSKAAKAPGPQIKTAPSSAVVSTAKEAGSGGPPASALERATGPVNGMAAQSSATSSKTATPIVETPQSVSVVGRKEIDQRGADSLQEALAYTPGVVSFASPRSRFLDEFVVRGFDTSTGDLGQLRDGLKLQANVYDGGQEPYGIERVDVLKGAASILFGQLGPGGVVNSISKRPSFDPKGEVNVTTGSFGNTQISADVTGSADPTLAYRLTVLGRDSDSWTDYINDDRRYIAPAFTWKPSDATTLTILSYYQETRTRFSAPLSYDGTVAAIPGVGRIPRDRFIGEPGFDHFDINSGAIGYLLEHRFDASVTFRSSARFFQADGEWDYLTFRGFNTSDPSDPKIVRGVSSRDEHSTNWATDNSVELKLGSDAFRHTAIAGIDYSRSNYDTTRFRSNGGGGLLSVFDPQYGAANVVVGSVNTGFDRVLNQVGIYGQDQLKIADTFVLLAGVRHDLAQTETLQYVDQSMTDQSDGATTWRLGGVYLGPWGFAPFASYSQSFSPVLAASYGVDETKPTTGEQYEGGVRWQSPDQKTLISAAVFSIDQRNVVTFTPDFFDFRQSGLVRSKGFEFEGKTQMGPLSMTLAYAYTDARTLKDEDPLYVDQRVPLVPFNQASIWLAYDFTTFGVPGVTLGGGVRYVGSTNLPDDEFGRDVPSYVIADALASVDLGKVSSTWKGYYAQFNAKNLFNEVSYSCASSFQGCEYGQPQTFTGTLSYRW